MIPTPPLASLVPLPHRLRLPALALALALAGAAATATRPARADDAAVAEATARFHEGLTLADAGKNEEARLKFTQALAVLKAPALLFNLARVEQLTGHDLDALEHFQQFLRASQNDPKVTDATRAKARSFIEDLAKKAARIEIVAPADARVTVDGRPVGHVAGDPVYVAPGQHVVEGTYQGRARSMTVNATAGAAAPAALVFDEPPSSTPTTEPPREPAKPTWPTAKIVTVASLGGTALVAGVLFVVFRAKAQGDVDDAKTLLAGSGCLGVTGDAKCDQALALRDDRDAHTTISNVAAVSGVVLAAGAVGAALFWPTGERRTGTRAVPLVGPGLAGMGLGGSF